MPDNHDIFSDEYWTDADRATGAGELVPQSPDPASVIDEQYQGGSETAGGLDKASVSFVKAKYEMEPESELYVSGKARRILIRGKIAQD